MERFRLNLVISSRSDPSLHGALQVLPVDIRAARLKELALAGLMGVSPRAVAPAAPSAVVAGAQAPAAAVAIGAKKAGLDIDGQLNGLDDIGLAL